MFIKILTVTKENIFPVHAINQLGQWPLEVQKANTEDALYFLLQEWEPSIVIIDLNGFPVELVSAIRRQSKNPFLGVIVCGDRLTPKQEVLCFNNGVDHLLPSSHEAWQMDCRIRSLVKRCEFWKQYHVGLTSAQGCDDKVLSFNEICLDPKRHVVTISGEIINMTPTQFRLLQTFMSYPGHLLTRSWLKDMVWNHLPISMRSIDAHISKLKKLFPVLDSYLVSVYGKGYRLSYEKVKAAS